MTDAATTIQWAECVHCKHITVEPQSDMCECGDGLYPVTHTVARGGRILQMYAETQPGTPARQANVYPGLGHSDTAVVAAPAKPSLLAWGPSYSAALMFVLRGGGVAGVPKAAILTYGKDFEERAVIEKTLGDIVDAGMGKCIGGAYYAAEQAPMPARCGGCGGGQATKCDRCVAQAVQQAVRAENTAESIRAAIAAHTERIVRHILAGEDHRKRRGRAATLVREAVGYILGRNHDRT